MGNVVSLLGITIVSSTHQCYVKKPRTQHPTLRVLEVEWRPALWQKIVKKVVMEGVTDMDNPAIITLNDAGLLSTLGAEYI